MHLEAHAGLGWTLGVLAPGSDRRLRAWSLAASVLPDADAVSYLFGDVAYGRYHHTFGHNLIVGMALTAAAAAAFRATPLRRRAVAVVIVALSFGLHLLADAKLSMYEIFLFWPLSRRGFIFDDSVALAAPVNTWLAWAGLATLPLFAWLRRVTPLEIVSPALDRVLLSVFQRRRLRCAVCERSCGIRCESCGRPICLRHGRLGPGFRVACPTCCAKP
jgi:membrane-bound metal-dependent hydrolase YbcI (DUF457 family)